MIGVQEGRMTRTPTKKLRHNKVPTAKGLRDRRVRLSADTAIQFYDVQDRLGFDRATEAVDWLILKAKSSIEKLIDASTSQEMMQYPINTHGDCSLELNASSYTGMDGYSELQNSSNGFNATVDFGTGDPYYQKMLEMSSNGERFTWSYNTVLNHNGDSSGNGKLPLFQH